MTPVEPPYGWLVARITDGLSGIGDVSRHATSQQAETERARLLKLNPHWPVIVVELPNTPTEAVNHGTR